MNKKLRNRLLNKTIRVINSCETMPQISMAKQYVDRVMLVIPMCGFSQMDKLRLYTEIYDLLMLKLNKISREKMQ